MRTKITDRPAVYVTRELPGDAVERLRRAASVRVWPEELPPPRDVLLREAAAADGLIAS
jgi:glyoxylate reductase